MLRNKRNCELTIFYDFAYKCEDNYEIMKRAIKMYHDIKPSIILQHLENGYISNYIDTMENITDSEIKKAKLEYKNEEINLFT